ncbi:MAG: acyl-[acyl-carrier-protein]--UDP-N-acetylglucosamine O-acyltransferase [Acidiphilium sp. 34-60-192]|nr:MAG: acyl-[acyl-carrier-protein]--UDP-N-acetylglucosamine O-acyltransferase [Acidiphilium sp. 34-60-192]
MIDPSASIHPTALIAPGATIAAGAKIGPFCTIGPDVVIGEGVEIISHVAVDGVTRIGADAKIFPFATIGLAPQDLKYKGEPTETEIGPRTMIREHCSIHRGTATGSGITRIGADCLLMAVVHVAHDCVINDRVIVSNNVVMGGHVRIGTGAMIGGVSGIPADVVPYSLVFGARARLAGLNIVGLKRRGLDRAALHRVRNGFNALFDDHGVLAERIETVRAAYGDDPYIAEMLAFITHPSSRGLITQRSRANDE